MKEKLEILVREALQALGVEVSAVTIERPADLLHGDYSTNAALVYAKVIGISPRELAGKLMDKIHAVQSKDIAKIEIAGAGFVNFFIADESIRKENTKEKSSLATKYSEKKILVEHSSVNLFKPFHIGHLVNNIIGEFVVRATKIGGGNVIPMSFPSDVSIGVAKAIYILLEDKKKGEDVFILSADEQVVVFGESYRRGVAYFEEHPEEIDKAKEIANHIYDVVSV